jgi:hypothetical protein
LKSGLVGSTTFLTGVYRLGLGLGLGYRCEGQPDRIDHLLDGHVQVTLTLTLTLFLTLTLTLTPPPPPFHRWGTFVSFDTDITIKGSATDIFILQVAGYVSVGANVRVNLEDGALASNIFWQVARIWPTPSVTPIHMVCNPHA